MLEYTFFLPVLIILLLSVAEFGNYFITYTRAQSTARELALLADNQCQFAPETPATAIEDCVTQEVLTSGRVNLRGGHALVTVYGFDAVQSTFDVVATAGSMPPAPYSYQSFSNYIAGDPANPFATIEQTNRRIFVVEYWRYYQPITFFINLMRNFLHWNSGENKTTIWENNYIYVWAAL